MTTNIYMVVPCGPTRAGELRTEGWDKLPGTRGGNISLYRAESGGVRTTMACRLKRLGTIA